MTFNKQTKNSNGMKILMFMILAMLVLPVIPVIAEDIPDYAVLAPLPGTTNDECNSSNPEDDACKTTLQKYIPGIFNLAIGLSAVAAVLFIIIGGFQYMTSDAIHGKTEGKDRIWNAIKGLALVISAWLILYTINPNLLILNLNIESPTTSAPAGGTLTTGTPMSDAEIAESNTIRDSLQKKGVGTYRGPCTKGETIGCVNLDGLTQSTQSSLANLASEFGSYVGKDPSQIPVLEITGATEGGHSTTGNHPKGNAVDFSFQYNPELINFVEKNGGTPTQTKDGPLYTVNIDNQDITFLKESNHWHVTFP